MSIICFEGSQVDFPNKCVFQSLNTAFIIANSADPDVRNAANNLFRGFQYTKGLFPILRLVQSSNAPGQKK